MKYCFIVNPNAGGGKGLKIWNRTRAYLARKNIDYEIFFTAASGDAAYIVRELTGEIQDEVINVFVIGGDGTLNEVLNGINHMSQVHVGYIPAGTGEDFARSLKLTHNPRKLIKQFQGVSGIRRLEAMDYGVLTCGSGEIVRRFANSSGIGFDAAVCSRMQNLRMKNSSSFFGRQKFGFCLEGLKELIFAKPCKGYIILDGNRRFEFNNLMFISTHIHPYEGGGFRFGNYADPKDGMLEICAVTARNKVKLLPKLLKSRVTGLKNSAGIRSFQCKEAHIHFERPSVVHADGEPLDIQTDLDLRCVRQQFNIYR